MSEQNTNARQGVALSDEAAFSQLCDKCNLTDTEEHQIAHMFWQAALSRASPRVEAVPVAWATVLPSGALHAMRTKRQDAERRTAAWNASHPRPPLATTEPLVRASSSRAEVEKAVLGWEAPFVIDHTHPNQAYVTLGFSSEAECKRFIKATRYGSQNIAAAEAPKGEGK